MGTIDLGVAMDIRTFTELTTPDERSLRFTPLGLATGGKLSPENAAEFQQRSIAAADLVPAIPEGTRSSFERLRTLHAYGVLCYDLFTVVADQTWVVLEQALRERFIEFYGGVIPLSARTEPRACFQRLTSRRLARHSARVEATRRVDGSSGSATRGCQCGSP